MIKKLLLYCTKSKPVLRIAKEEMKHQNRARCYSKEETKYFTQYIEEEMYEANGKIVAECDFEVEEIKCEEKYGVYYTNNINAYDLINKSYLSAEQLDEYLKGKNGYAIHIKNLYIFDEPRELNKYADNKGYNIKKAPQNMMYACKYSHTSWNDIFDYYILISIRPEYLVRILNKEKTIEIRKKILKEML